MKFLLCTFLNGHGEEGYDSLMNMIANNGAEVEEINLMTDTSGFDPASKLMVICNPKGIIPIRKFVLLMIF